MTKQSAVEWLFEQIPFEVTSNRAAMYDTFPTKLDI